MEERLIAAVTESKEASQPPATASDTPSSEGVTASTVINDPTPPSPSKGPIDSNQPDFDPNDGGMLFTYS